VCPVEGRTIVDGVLSAGGYRVDVDSVLLILPTGEVYYPTPGWGADSGDVDSASVAETDDWPFSAKAYLRINGAGDYSMAMDPLVADSWYLLEDVPPPQPRIKLYVGVGASERSASPLPGHLVVSNPAGSEVRLEVRLSRPAAVRLELYDVTGTLVRTIFDGPRPAGSTSLSADASALSRGLYLLRLESTDFTTTRKLVLE
jgi:hypothetical protein